ncbi:MAG: tyrosine--tRNA ligase [Candidatus Fermentibacteraceae bacterium]
MELLATLNERGLVYQMTGSGGLSTFLDEEPRVFYAGFDATADSLHLGHLVPLMAAAHLQRAGHKPIVLVGGATALVGDPSGRCSERSLLTVEDVERNVIALKEQVSRFLDFGPGGAEILNNAQWLMDLNYITFLRDIGKHFSVNRMLTADSVRTRLETGLSFLEFNYMLLQSYDFLHLFRTRGCLLQLGGADQWGNIVAGVDLVRRMAGMEAHGFTVPLVTTSTGEKMSKSQPGGAVWLDPEKTSPYDYYQFWINTDDRDLGKFLRLYTFLPIEQVRDLESRIGADLRAGKETLAFEATTIAHGPGEAEAARNASRTLFQGAGSTGDVPTFKVGPESIALGVTLLDLFVMAGLATSRGEVRRLSEQGGLYADGERVTDVLKPVTLDDFSDNGLLLRAGKKRYCRIVAGEL